MTNHRCVECGYYAAGEGSPFCRGCRWVYEYRAPGQIALVPPSPPRGIEVVGYL